MLKKHDFTHNFLRVNYVFFLWVNYGFITGCILPGFFRYGHLRVNYGHLRVSSKIYLVRLAQLRSFTGKLRLLRLGPSKFGLEPPQTKKTQQWEDELMVW